MCVGFSLGQAKLSAEAGVCIKQVAVKFANNYCCMITLLTVGTLGIIAYIQHDAEVL